MNETRTPLVVFCGKGGVGKTTLSLAVGMAHAARGVQVSVVTSHPVAELRAAVSLQGLSQTHPAVAAHLSVVHIDPRVVLDAAFEKRFPAPALARTVLSSRIYRNMVDVAPGIKELAFLARLREVAEPQPRPHHPGCGLLVWDAPATGHFLQTLKVAGQLDTYLSGPLADAGRSLQRFFAERALLRIFPVTTLEEMAVQETVDLVRALRTELRLSPSGVVGNLVSPLLHAGAPLPDASRAVPGLDEEGAAHLRFVARRLLLEQREFEDLRERLNLPCTLVRRVSGARDDLNLLDRLQDDALALEVGWR